MKNCAQWAKQLQHTGTPYFKHTNIYTHRKELFEIRGAYILQNAWRSVMAKRVRSDKMKTRHLAAARIQALWKGFWTRSRMLLFIIASLDRYCDPILVWTNRLFECRLQRTATFSFHSQNVSTLWNRLSSVGRSWIVARCQRD